MQDQQTTTSIGHLPAGKKWQFDAEVTTCFDDMLRRSIPQYAVMRQAVFDIAAPFVQPHTDIVDLGCSRGEALLPFIDRFGAANRFVGLEVSEPMIAAARARFRSLIESGVVDIRNFDLRNGYPPLRASVTLSVLTLQFTPIEYRHRIVRNVFKSLTPGGAFVLVEKILGGDADTDALLVDRYYALKSANGYSREEIDRKRCSLEGVLVPVTARWNEELLKSAGFSRVECFWRWMNFGSWLAVRSA